ncbi:hypothetical protein ACFGVS_06955 [Mucilaginibacter sp. AW1-7]|uniref:hypothetical protein n=1 Tax=Mucilaginibacter sp. AW1-7 TaxID=3349874 RepID=UPI003F73563C
MGIEELLLERAEKKGRNEGRKEEAVAIAREMKKEGLPVAQIKKSTGLSVEEIEKL